jgi:hypothetical protein
MVVIMPFARVPGRWRQVVGFQVALEVVGLPDRDADEHEGELVVGGDGGEAAVAPDVGGEPVDRQPSQVRVVGPLEHRLVVIPVGADRGRPGVPPIGSHDHPRPVVDRGPTGSMAEDADHVAVLDEHILDGEAFAHLRAGTGGGVDEDAVQDDAPRRVSNRRAVPGTRCPVDHERSEVEDVPLQSSMSLLDTICTS